MSNEMEHKQRSTHEPLSSTSAHHSSLEELDAASSSVHTSIQELISSRYWTSVESASDTDDEGYVRTLPGRDPGRDVQKYNMGEIKLLEKIGEGGQGTIYTAQLSSFEFSHTTSRPKENVVIAKVYKGRSGQWPEDVCGLHLLNSHVCQFHGYCLEGESFYLVMEKYDCSLRDLLHLLMENQCQRRPLSDIMTLCVIIQIAVGMCFLHENNIIHRDLKADNVFVNATGFSNGVPPIACIGDFDVASKVVGTLFWRAPEILQALKDGKRPVFTPKADVYSFAMTCYEILTGCVPLEELRVSDYDAVLQHRARPKLPSNLNLKFKNFMERCWHHDPELRPTFKEIVVKLNELHRELIIGSKLVLSSIESYFSGSSALDNEASPEACVVELKELFQALLVKYGQEDFLLVGLEMVADLEQYQLEFGLRSFMEHPVLSFPEFFKRHKIHDRIRWKFKVFGRFNSPFIAESNKIARLLTIIMSALNENFTSSGYIADQSESEEIIIGLEWKAWHEECDARVLPESQHAVCVESPQQSCDLCRFNTLELMEDLNPEDFLPSKSYLYVEIDLEP